ncbi:unnamed protein product [Symbiodinium microadriaticum]|nr:unnamed protein product [Symbiodinium microadriaticum]CAE7950030.1 unnamed protein product [Symbiodinium sp. KB8]
MLYPPANAVSVLCHQSLNKMKSIHAIFAEMKSENWSQSPAKAQAKLANSYVTADALPSQAASSQQLGDHDSRCWAQAEHLAHEAAACKEAWDARAAVRLLRQSAALMESANAARKQLRRAANEVLQVLDVEDPKTRSLVGDALRTFGVQ